MESPPQLYLLQGQMYANLIENILREVIGEGRQQRSVFLSYIERDPSYQRLLPHPMPKDLSIIVQDHYEKGLNVLRKAASWRGLDDKREITMQSTLALATFCDAALRQQSSYPSLHLQVSLEIL